MQQIFIFGSSSVYGVGSTFGGWSGLLKNKLHEIMFGENGIGERFEVFNFGYSGATIDIVKDTYLDFINKYKRGGKIIVLINVGGNDMKAEDSPINYVSSPEQYKLELRNLLVDIKRYVDEIIFVGSGYIDESKTTPKLNPLTGGYSYFFNNRKTLFDKVTTDICKELEIKYIGVDVPLELRIDRYLYKDGLHFNNLGHTYIFNKIWIELKKMIKL